MLAWIVLLPLLTIALCAVTWRYRSVPSVSVVLPGLLGTIIGTAASLAVYVWVFDRSRCPAGRNDIACMLNQNQGLLTALALVLAVAGLWVAAVYRARDFLAAARQRRAQVREAVRAAVNEVAHNLIHIAIVSDGETHKIRALPQLTLDDQRRLCEPDLRGLVDAEAVWRCQNVARNYEAFVGATDERDALHRVGAITVNSLAVLYQLAGEHRDDVADILALPGWQDIRRLTSEAGGVYMEFRASGAEPAAADLRSTETPVLCWFDDGGPRGVEVVAEYQRFWDMEHPPH